MKKCKCCKKKKKAKYSKELLKTKLEIMERQRISTRWL